MASAPAVALCMGFCAFAPPLSAHAQPNGEAALQHPDSSQTVGRAESPKGPIRFEWLRQAGAESCPSPRAALRVLSTLDPAHDWRLASELGESPDAVRIRISIRRDADAEEELWRAVVDWVDAVPPRESLYFSQSRGGCRGLADRVLLSLSLVLPDSSPPEPMQDPGRRDEEVFLGNEPQGRSTGAGAARLSPPTSALRARNGWAQLRGQKPTPREGTDHAESNSDRDAERRGSDTQLGFESGILVGPVGTIPAFFEMSMRWRFLGAAAWITTPANARDNPSPAAVEIWMGGGSLNLCPWTTQHALGTCTLCLSTDLGVLRGSAERAPDHDAWVFYLANRLRFSGAFFLSGPVSLIGSIAAGPVWIRPRFDAIDDGTRTPLFTSSSWVGSLSAGVSLSL